MARSEIKVAPSKPRKTVCKQRTVMSKQREAQMNRRQSVASNDSELRAKRETNSEFEAEIIQRRVATYEKKEPTARKKQREKYFSSENRISAWSVQ